MIIEIFSHIVDIGCGKEITKEQTELLENTGLLDAADAVNLFTHYEFENYIWLEDRWKDKKNVNFFHYDKKYQPWYEATTVNFLQEYCHQTDEEFYVCFMTHKGASHGPGAHQNWRKYMQYWNIEKWKECVAKLDEGYDTCGASFLNNPPYPFYAGNFFWAKASYLRKCKRLKTPEENNFRPQFQGQPHHRFDLECWHGSGNPKWYDMHPGEDNRWYLPPENYRTDVEQIFEYRTDV
jgi:hypothetical protein